MKVWEDQVFDGVDVPPKGDEEEEGVESHKSAVDEYITISICF